MRTLAYDILAEISREIPEQCKDTDGFMFAAYGCAVFEKELDDGCYEYAALNLSSGATLTLERRKNPITHATVERLVRKLRDSKIAGSGRLEISGETPRPQKLMAVLSELFRDIFPRYGYGIREGQIKLAEQLLGAIAGRLVLIAEASTGLGKTLVYIIVGALVKRSGINLSWSGSYYPGMSAVEWRRMPVLISTSSIALQKSALDYIKEVSKILMENGVIKTPLRAMLKKGRANYVCEHNLRSYMPFERNAFVLEELRRLISGGVIDLAETDGLTPHVKKKICVPARCYQNCPYSEDCLYMAFRGDADGSEFDFIVTNHNLLLMDAKLRAEAKRAVLPPVQMYVVDEAHQLINAARSIYGAELSVETIPETVKSLLAMNFTPLSANNREWREVRDAVSIMAKQLLSLNEQLFILREADSDCDGLLRNIRATADYLRKVLKGSHKFKVKRDQQHKYRLMGELERLSEEASALSENDELLRWFEREQGETVNLSLCGLPKRLNERIYEDLWKRGVPALLTSGTLSANGDFSAFKRTAGIKQSNRVIETVQPSPYDYRNNCLLYLSNKVPYPKQSSKKYIDALTEEVERLIRAAHGHTAVLFTSYNVMGRVYKKLEKRGLPFPLFKLERSTSNAIDRFKESGNGVLFAAGALWEGIDIPGDALSMLIIVKLPFASPDRVSEYEQTQYPSFREYLEQVLTPEMLVKLKQGFGRLLRLETDTGVVAILDIRAYFDGAYYDPIIDTLPDCRVTDDIGETKRFIRAVKGAEYFEIH